MPEEAINQKLSSFKPAERTVIIKVFNEVDSDKDATFTRCLRTKKDLNPCLEAIGLPPDCYNPDGNSWSSDNDSLFSFLSRFPKGQGYNVDVHPKNVFCDNVKNIVDDTNKIGNSSSHCTIASYQAILYKIRHSSHWDRPEIKSAFSSCSSGAESPYGLYLGSDGLRNLFEKYQLGNTKVIQPGELAQYEKQGWPSEGDPILFQRHMVWKGREQITGHSAIFTRYMKKNDQITHICYWSSNTSTDGYGEKCEIIDYKKMINLHVGKIK